MRQVVQDIQSGATTVREIPDPIAPPGGVVIATMASLISAGTEKYVVELAKKSLLAKARERPDHVRRVLQKIKQEGLLNTAQQVRAKLAEPMPLGYSSSGVVLACGKGVQEYKPGDRVAVVGPHAGVIAAGRNLCARVPDNVSFEQAAYASVGAIALEGVRLAKVTLGERVMVIGLGLIGQMAVCLLKAQGCKVFGVDLDPKKLELAKSLGADAVGLGSPREAVRVFANNRGVDAVVITAATPSNEPIEFAADACRVRGRIVLVGVVGLNLPRPPFFQKELEFTVSASLGPGRWDTAYEEKGIDYPFGHVRWTMQRNMEAVLDTISEGKLPVERLTTHRLPIDRAAAAYDLITEAKEPFLGIILEHPTPPLKPKRRVVLSARPAAAGKLGIGMVGAGNFARLVLLPTLAKLGGVEFRGLCSARGLNAESSGRRLGFAYATTDYEEVLADPATHAVFIATRHDLHAEQVIKALRAKKHVFVEKPLCITPEQLADISRCVGELGVDCPVLMVGFNRRFAPATLRVKQHFEGVAPLAIHFRFATAPIPFDAWPQDESIGGGRIVGEACHAIDTCTAIARSVPVRVYAESVGKVAGTDTTDDQVFITLRHENGSISSISYQAGAERAGPKERIEVFGGGRTAVIDDWDRVDLWRGARHTRARGNNEKGHTQGLSAFIAACHRGAMEALSTEDSVTTTWASLQAMESIRSGIAFERFPNVVGAA